MNAGDARIVALGGEDLRFLGSLAGMVASLPGVRESGFRELLGRAVAEAARIVAFDAYAIATAGEGGVRTTICLVRPAGEAFVSGVRDGMRAACRALLPGEGAAFAEPEVVVLPAGGGSRSAGRVGSAEYRRLEDGCRGLAGMFREDAGGHDPKDVFLFEILSRWLASCQVLTRTFRGMEDLSVTDFLTGACNRRKFADELAREAERVRRYDLDLSLIMIDLDGLKQINDSNGHLAGDAVLRRVARGVLSAIRKVDLLARFGGDEFALLLPHTPPAGAAAVADRIMARCCNAETQWEDRAVAFSVSAGVATMSPRETAEELVARADVALYEAKLRGRGRYVVAA